jgi:hypothetical protein
LVLRYHPRPVPCRDRPAHGLMVCVAIYAAVGRLFRSLMACRSSIACRSTCLKSFSCARATQDTTVTSVSKRHDRARYTVAQIPVTPPTHEIGCTQPSLPNFSYPHVAAYISILDTVSCGVKVSMRSRMADLKYRCTVACKRLTGLRLRRSTPFIKPTAWQSSSEFETLRGVQS